MRSSGFVKLETNRVRDIGKGELVRAGGKEVFSQVVKNARGREVTKWKSRRLTKTWGGESRK